jgi:hypothetical protein
MHSGGKLYKVFPTRKSTNEFRATTCIFLVTYCDS